MEHCQLSNSLSFHSSKKGIYCRKFDQFMTTLISRHQRSKIIHQQHEYDFYSFPTYSILRAKVQSYCRSETSGYPLFTNINTYKLAQHLKFLWKSITATRNWRGRTAFGGLLSALLDFLFLDKGLLTEL